jgi:hypothetical protein
MADIQNKHSVPRAQGRSRRAHAQTKPAVKTGKRSLPLLPPPVISRRGKTTIRRNRNRSFHRFEEVKGKPVDFIEFYTSGDYHVVDVRFEDKTAMHFAIEPGFMVEPGYSDWKTGNWRPIKRWPLIRSAGLKA